MTQYLFTKLTIHYSVTALHTKLKQLHSGKLFITHITLVTNCFIGYKIAESQCLSVVQHLLSSMS